jgi:hypothetical protein
MSQHYCYHRILLLQSELVATSLIKLKININGNTEDPSLRITQPHKTFLDPIEYSITVSKTASCASWNRTVPWQAVAVILPCPDGLPLCKYPWSFPTGSATCPTYLILLNFVIPVMISCEFKHKILFINILRPSVSSFPLGPDIFFRAFALRASSFHEFHVLCVKNIQHVTQMSSVLLI